MAHFKINGTTSEFIKDSQTDIFYNSDQEVSWYLFSDSKRYLCNVLEDYSNIIIFGVVFYNFRNKKQ